MNNYAVPELKTWIKWVSEIQDVFIGEIREREKINKYISKYVNILEFFYVNLAVLSITSRSIKIVSYLSAIAAPVVLMMSSFIIVYITLGNGFVKLLLSKLNSKKRKHKNWNTS